MTRIVAESKRLDQAEVEAEELFRERRAALLKAQQDLDEALGRLDRLRRQKRLVVTRGADMVRRGLESLDDLEAAEQRESDAAVAMQAAGGFGVIDWSVPELANWLESEPGVGLGSGDGTSATVSHSSPGVS